MIVVMLGLLGLCLGSFINAFTWRLHAGKVKTMLTDRSRCEHCHKTLGALELIPVIGWVALRGKCRHCKKPIGIEHPLFELAVAAAFILSYVFWPRPLTEWYLITEFIIWLIMLVGVAALCIYDIRWYILPDVIVWPLVGLSILSAVLQFVTYQPYGPLVETLQYHVFGLLPIAGLYWFIYTFSKGKLVGFGDVKLGIFIGLTLGWAKSLLVLFLANIVGSLIVLPLLMLKKVKRSTRIPFGPLLLIGFFIASIWGDAIINWYVTISFRLLP